MGLVQRQSLKYSLVNWVGVLIAVFSTLFVYPRALEEYGFLRLIIDTSMMIYPLISFGVNSVAIRFFSKFEDESTKHHGYLPYLMLWGLSGYILFLGLLFFAWPWIQSYYSAKNPLFEHYLWMLVPVSFLTLINNIFNQYAINFKRIVIPSLLLDFSQKLTLPLLILAYWSKWISLDLMLMGLLGYLILVSAGFIFYIISLRAWTWRPDFSFINKKLVYSMFDYAIYGIIGGGGLLLITKLDGLMISSMVSLKSNGIYSISTFIANVMDVPNRALIGITVPLLARHWNDGNTAEIDSLYRKSSINLLLVGLLLFGSFWISVTPFYQIVANGETLKSGKTVILLLGIAQLINMATGLNNYVLVYSKFFRYSVLQVCLPALLSLLLNLWLVPTMGLTGAAISTCSAVILYNLFSVALNWYFFKMQPFSWNALKVLGLAAICFLLVSWIPAPDNPWFAIVLKSGTFASLFSAAAFFTKISPDLNGMLLKFLKK